MLPSEANAIARADRPEDPQASDTLFIIIPARAPSVRPFYIRPSSAFVRHLQANPSAHHSPRLISSTLFP